MDSSGQHSGTDSTVGKFPDRSLSRDLTAILALLMAVVLAGLLGADYLIRSHQMRQELAGEAQQSTENLAQFLVYPVWTFDQSALVQVVESFAQNREVNAVRVLDPSGRTLYETSKQRLDPDAAIHRHASILHEGEHLGSTEVEFSLLPLKKELKATLGILGLTFLVVMAFLVSVTAALMRSRLRRSLAPLETGMHRVARGEFDEPLGRAPYQEFHGIAEAFDLMIDRLRRRRAELTAEIAERQRAEERYALAVQGANDGIWDWDLVSGRIYFSRRFKEILGFAEDEFPDDIEEWKRRIHPDDRQMVVDAHHNFMAGLDDTLDLEYRLRHRDGTWRIVHAQGASGKSESGEPVRIAGAIADITERRTAQQALKESEERFRMLFEGAPDAIFIESVDDDRIIEANEAACRMLGYTHDEITAMTVADLQAPEVRGEAGTILASELTQGEFFEGLDVRKDGTRLPVEVRNRRIRLAGQDVVLSVVRDITQRKAAEKALKESEEHYRAIVDAFDGLIYICDAEGTVSFMNDNLKERTGRDATGEKCHKALHNLEERCSWCVLDRVIKGETVRWELKSPKDDRWYYVVNTPIFHPDGSVSKQAMIQDITERKAAEDALRESEERYRSLIETTAEGFVLLDTELNVQDTNEALCDMLGMERGEIVNHDFLEFMDDESREVVLAQAERRAESPHRMYEFAFTRSSGEQVSVLASSTSMFRPDGTLAGSFAFFTDITDRKRMENQLRYQAMHDPLTGLSNRTLCLDRIHQALERARRREDYYYAVFFLDLDRFKVINDSMGHAFGDRLLIEASHRLLECVRDLDTVSRFGGDEFIVLLEELGSPRKAIQVVKRMRKELRKPFTIDGHEVQLTASIGIVLGPTDFKKPDDLLQYANIAMHRAKGKGRDRFKVFTTKLLESAMHQMALENHMERALAEGEFFLNYQPIIRLTGGSRLYGFEALARWDHPSRGLIPPGEFIPVAEETGMIMDLGLWVLSQASRTMVQWQKRHPEAADLILSVNISGRQFSQHDLASRIRRILEGTGLPAHQLKLEITETALMENAATAVDILRQLKELGVTLSIDDFGTGYSSMSYLQRLPLDNLKIDLSFIQLLDRAPENIEIVKAIINLAHTLELEVVAEGVERVEHQRILAGLGCDFCQGYLYARPLKDEDAEAFLADMRHWALPD